VAIRDEVVEQGLAIARKSPENYKYFFERLNSADWIEPLEKRGMFNEPPPLAIEGGYVSAPVWPPSQFLVKVAREAPEAVLRIALGVATDNERVHEDLAEAASAMPAPLAAKWAEHELAWLRDRERLYFLLPEKLTQLATHLARSGDAEPAVQLVTELFRPVGVEREAAGPWDLRTAVTRISNWQYDMLLDKALPPLLEAAPGPMLRAVGELLGQCLDLAQANVEDPKDDYSYVWRPRVADDHRDDQEPEQALVSALRDLAVSSRERGLLRDDELAELLLADGRAIFRRIAMFALAMGPEPDPRVVSDFVMDTETLRNDHPSVEYQSLLERASQLLTEDEKRQLVTWIEAGPDTERFIRRAREYVGNEPTREDVEEYVDTWRARRLRLLRAGLSDEQRQEYDGLVERVGEQRFTVPFEVTTWMGPTSPVRLDELRQLDDDQIIGFLTTWEEPNGRYGPEPSVEGLGRALSELAEQEPERMSRLSTRLRGLRAYYTYWTLIGLSSAVRNKKTIEWAPVLELVNWLLEQETRPVGAEPEPEDESTVFGWARKDAAALIEAGLRSTESPIALELRLDVWQILTQLAEDADPAPERERRDDGSSFDPATLALNSTRGCALRAVVTYGLWVRRLSEGEEDGAAHEGFDAMPEVREVLESHLDPARDPSPAVRTIYGQFLPQLAYLDVSWVRANAPRIFPREETLEHLREAAWGAYIVFSPPYNDLLELLRSYYELAVERISEERAGIRWMGSSESPEERLADHLMSFYWWGRLSLDEDDLVRRFFAIAPGELRAHAIEFLGRSARDFDRLEDDILQRLEVLWEIRISHGLDDLSDDSRNELKAFSWWLSVSSLPLEWRLAQLERLLDAGVIPAPEFLVFELFQAGVSEAPAPVARLLRPYLEGIRGSWAIGAHASELEAILRTALDPADPVSYDQALETIQLLGALGFRQFRELLRGRDS
jgi:hypothetical protein